MDDRRRQFGRVLFAHGSEGYPRSANTARRWVCVLGLLLLVLGSPRAEAGPRARVIKANGKWHRFHIGAPEEVHVFLFETTAGCRYRVTIEGRTLDRVLLEMGPGGATLWRADTRPADDLPKPQPPPRYPTAEQTWDAETGDVLEARVRGFSMMMGRGRIRLETMDPDGKRVKAHRRFLAPGELLARVGSLWVASPDRWELVTTPGTWYEVRSRPGTAGRIALAVRTEDGTELAVADPSHALPYPSAFFQAPEAPLEGEPAPGVILEVTSVDGSGGTYGVRLHEGPPRPPPVDAPPPPAPPAVESGVVHEKRFVFRANPGDVALLHLPRTHVMGGHWVQRQDEAGRWTTLPQDAVSVHGERASMRTPERAAMVWFRAFRPGTYRIVEPVSDGATFALYPAAEVPEAPLLIGTGHDPSVPARARREWLTIGVGVCMPGWDYLFVAVGRRKGAVGMRVVDVGGKTRALRAKRGLGLTRVAGLGPSLRFRVKEATLVRLEIRGSTWEGHALLRRAGN